MEDSGATGRMILVKCNSGHVNLKPCACHDRFNAPKKSWCELLRAREVVDGAAQRAGGRLASAWTVIDVRELPWTLFCIPRAWTVGSDALASVPFP